MLGNSGFSDGLNQRLQPTASLRSVAADAPAYRDQGL
jgi:hypothetical protein